MNMLAVDTAERIAHRILQGLTEAVMAHGNGIISSCIHTVCIVEA